MWWRVLFLAFVLASAAARVIRSDSKAKLIIVKQLDDHFGERDKRSAFKFPPTMRFNLTDVEDNNPDDVMLTLKANTLLSVNPPVYQTVNGDIQEVNTEKYSNHALYQDFENGAAMLVECGDTKWSCKLTGTFHKNENKYHVAPSDASPMGLSTQHLLNKVDRSEIDLGSFKRDGIQIPKRNSTHQHGLDELPILGTKSERSKRMAVNEDIPLLWPYDVYIIELMLFPDYAVYKRFYKMNKKDHNATVAAMTRHYALILTEIHLRLQSIQYVSPELMFRLYISGLHIATSEEEAPWAYKNVLPNNDPPLLSSAALFSFSNWQSENRDKFPRYDYAIAFTGLEYAYPSYEGYAPDLLGNAWISAMCYWEDYYNAAVIEDKGDFVTADIAVHEMGHSLGAYHDKDAQLALFWDDISCSYDRYNVMAESLDTPPESNASNPYYFSECSVKQIEKHINMIKGSDGMDYFNCLQEHDLNIAELMDLLYPGDKILPGVIFDIRRQCKQKFGQGSKPQTLYAEEMCLTGVNCMMKGEVVGVQTVLDGTMCSKENKNENQPRKWCWKNQCVEAGPTTEFYEEKRECTGEECCSLIGPFSRCCKNLESEKPCAKWFALLKTEDFYYPEETYYLEDTYYSGDTYKDTK